MSHPEARGGTSAQARPAADEDPLAHRLAAFARALQAADGRQAVLEVVVQHALDIVPGADEGSISVVVGRRRVEAQAASADLPRQADELQEEVGEGPCLSAAFEHTTVRVDDVAHDPRWPRFGARAARLGVGSMLSLQLFVEDDDLGALNLYGRAPASFDELSERVGLLFAAHAAVAYSAAQREAALQAALASRQAIGQAQGILMARSRCTADEAFDELKRVSQAHNTKLTDVAARLVETGELAG